MRNYNVFAVDFDGTLSLGDVKYPEIGKPNIKLIQLLKDKKKAGHKIILWTCREGDPLKDAMNWCAKLGLIFDAVNDNLPELKSQWGNNPRKIAADYYIDDKAVSALAFY